MACAVALKNLQIMERDGIPGRVRDDLGPYLHQRLRAALGDHALVGEIRGEGLLAAIELVDDKAERRFFASDRDVGLTCRNHCFQQGLVMRAIRDTMVLSPPLTISRAEIDEVVRRARLCIDLTAKDVSRF